MKSPSSASQFFVSRFLSWGACLWPTLLLAHPGHYHPEETDEFDFLRATFFHSHGALDYLVGVVFLVSLACCFLSGKPAVRLAGLAAAVGSLAAIPLF